MGRYSSTLIAFAVIPLLFSCKKETITALQEELTLEVPSHFPQPTYSFQGNPLSIKKFELGRKLFYDTYLSSTNTISCASCHHQQYAFSDAGNALSSGVNGTLGSRNSPAMFNLIWNTSFMWDGGINHIEIMPLAPITDHREMNIPMPDLIAKLNSSPSYKALFKDAFEVETITDYELFLALTQFMGMMISADSKYDKYIQGNASLTDSELLGLELFRNHCASCHTEPLFSDMDFHNNGLDSEFQDDGRYLITLISSDKGKFRTPSLRNIEVTYPYMHDGRFQTLEEVLEHYTNGIQHSATLAPGLISGIQLSPGEQEAIIAFLKTLTDYTFLSNSKFAPVD